MAFFLSEGVFAQGFPNQNQKFSPEKYQADMEQYIAKEAGLTPQEASAFFPLFREMQQKQRALYNQMMAEVRIKPADAKACKGARAGCHRDGIDGVQIQLGHPHDLIQHGKQRL